MIAAVDLVAVVFELEFVVAVVGLAANLELEYHLKRVSHSNFGLGTNASTKLPNTFVIAKNILNKIIYQAHQPATAQNLDRSIGWNYLHCPYHCSLMLVVHVPPFPVFLVPTTLRAVTVVPDHDQ